MAKNTAATPPAGKAVPDVNRIVDAWFEASVHNSPASRDTTVFNHLARAKEQLKADLVLAIQGAEQ